MRRIPILALAVMGLTAAVARAGEVFRGSGVNREALKMEYTLTLDKDGTAELASRMPRYTSTEQCTWQRKDGEFTLQYRDIENRPRGTVVVWRESKGTLTPLRWGKEEWGERGPPALRGG